MLERRRHARIRDFAAGSIAYGQPRATVDCVVRDLSDGGALLLLDEPRRAPVHMQLALRGGVRSAQIVWRGETAVGVAFPARDAVSGTAPVSDVVVSLAAARRARTGGSDEQRLAARIARFVRPLRRPD